METRKILITCAALVLGLIVLVSARNIMDGGYAPSSNNQISNYNPGLQNPGSGSQNNAPPATVTNGVQNVVLSLDAKGDYSVSAALKKGVPVKMEVDLSSVIGCARSVVIPGFNVRKNVRQGDNIIEFTPDKTGTFAIHCSMNMYRGTFTVLDENGQTSDFAEQAPAPSSGGSCGAGSGGCGCGGGV